MKKERNDPDLVVKDSHRSNVSQTTPYQSIEVENLVGRNQAQLAESVFDNPNFLADIIIIRNPFRYNTPLTIADRQIEDCYRKAKQRLIELVGTNIANDLIHLADDYNSF